MYRRRRLHLADLAWWCTAPCRCRPSGRRSRLDRRPTVAAWARAASVVRSRTRGRWRLGAACLRARSSRFRLGYSLLAGKGIDTLSSGYSLKADQALPARPRWIRCSTTGSRTRLSRGVPGARRRDESSCSSDRCSSRCWCSSRVQILM